MCNFFSCILTSKYEVLEASEYTDSHDLLIEHFGLRDSVQNFHRQPWVRVEFIPPKTFTTDLSQWKLVLDETNTPDWWDVEKARNVLESHVRPHIIVEDRSSILGGWWIVDGCTVNNFHGGVIKILHNSTVQKMRGNSTVQEMWGNSTVQKMRDNSTVQAMWGSSAVEEVLDRSLMRRWLNKILGGICSELAPIREDHR